MYSHEKWMDEQRFCECPAHATWHATDKKCVCPSGKILTNNGCIKDYSEECYKKPMSIYEEHENVCVTIMNCANIYNCRKCEMRMYYESPEKNTPLRCVECNDKYSPIAGKCVHHETPREDCTQGTYTTALAKYEGCLKCMKIDTAGSNLACVECK